MRCGKVIYPSAHQVHYVMKKRKDEGVKLNYYFCEYCDGYHLTSMKPKAQEAFKKSIERAHRLKLKKVEEIKTNPIFTPMFEAWEELEDFKEELEDFKKELKA